MRTDLVLSLLVTLSCLSCEPTVLQVISQTGTYKGLVQRTSSGVDYTAFLGIKFADVVQRFHEAVPVKNESSTSFDATQFGPPCFQKNSKYVGSEDCLYLNIYTPDVVGDLPVLFFIYGGGFTTGSTVSYDPEYFMDTKRIVVVTVAYRVGPFGFLYLDDPEFPANLGLRDQILGLHWVRDNIHSFGGNPARVTINGQSAGAASVSILMHSPLAKGLFVGAISESGCSCSPWALQPRCTGLHKLRLLASGTGCDGYLPETTNGWSARNLVGCLNKLKPEDIADAVETFPKWDQIVPFPPIVETPESHEPVISVFPWLNTSQSKDLVPWITGVNSGEAATFVREYYPKNVLESLAVRLFNGFVLSDLMYYRFTARYPILVTANIKLHFFRDNLLNVEQFLSEVLSLGFFYYPNYQCLLTDLSPTYGYLFNYRKQSETGRTRRLHASGLGHGGELPFIWKQHSDIRLQGTDTDKEISENLVNTWIDFAYNQYANYSGLAWEKYDREANRLLVINEHGAEMRTDPNGGDNSFWRSLATNLDPSINHCTV